MAAGEIVFARTPIDLDIGSAKDTAVVQAFATALFPIAVYDVIHATIIPPIGTKTKAMLIVVAQSIT